MSKRNFVNRLPITICIIVITLCLAAAAMADENSEPLYKNKRVAVERRIEDLVGRMTLEEKIALLTADNSAGTSLDTAYNKRLQIPRFSMTDGPHGASFSKNVKKGATAFPVGINMGATWNTTLLTKIGIAIAEETKAQGRNVILGPCLDIQRTPTRGRNFESFSEDPYLMSKLGAAYIQGVQSQNVIACAKHFVANTQEWHRMYISSEVDERALHEIYMAPFRAAVQEADVWFVMASYNKLNGEYTCANHWLLNEVLKKEWGFKGVVVSDWGAVHSTLETALGGCDIEMGGTTFMGQPLLEAIKNGHVKESVVDEKVRRILYVMMISGLFDAKFAPRENAEQLYKIPEPEGPFEKSMYGDVAKEYKMQLDSPAHRALALDVARESLVLLKNDRNALPLNKKTIKKIAVFGPNAYTSEYSGGGSAEVIPTYVVSALEGLMKKAGQDIEVVYYRGAGFERRYNIPNVPGQFLRPVDGAPGQRGLTAEYFNNRNLEGPPAVKRIDDQIFFHYCGSAPAPGVNPHDFSVRWTGTLSVPQTAIYTLTAHHHGAFYANEFGDGVRVSIDGKKVMDDWEPVISEVPSADVFLESGKEYDLTFEYHDAPGINKSPIVIFGWLPLDNELEKAAAIAHDADAAIIVGGYNRYYEGENNDRGSMRLQGKQEALIKAVAKANKRSIVVLYNGGPVLMNNWVNDVPAVLTAWYPGQEGGNAVAEAIFGEINPSGKLPCTFGLNREDYPDWGNYPGDGEKVFFKEGIYVGYRHFDKNNIEVQYPFGYGLSYTRFEYRNIKLSSKTIQPDQKLTITMDIRNTGKLRGSEVVQLYIHDVESSVDKSVRELKAFKKVQLDPGQTKTISFEIDQAGLSYYSVQDKKWLAEDGQYEVQIGSSSRDIRLKDQFKLTSKK
jgi:beta-glucosidase